MNLARICLLALLLGPGQAGMAQERVGGDGQFQSGATAEQSGHFSQAARAYRQTIKTLTKANGQYNIALIEPLLGLGRSLIHTGDYQGAIDALREAQYIMHRTDGVDTLQQLGVIDLLRQVNLDQDKPLDANREARFSLFVSEHHYGKDSPDVLPAIYKLSNWYIDTGQHTQARHLLARGAKIIAARFGKTDPHMIDVLTLMARNARLNRECCSYRFLERAREIVEAHPDMSRDARAGVYISLGDAYTADFKTALADAAYARAWQLLGKDAATREFASPRPVAASHELDQFRRLYTDYYTAERDYPFGGVHLTRLSDNEVLSFGSLPPQQFSVLNAAPARFQITDRLVPNKVIGAAQRLTGHPFQFLQSQLREILPHHLVDDAALAKLTVQLDFTVAGDGRASDVVVSGDKVPPGLANLLRKVVGLTKFRPRIVDGKPVTTKHVKLVQTFG